MIDDIIISYKNNGGSIAGSPKQAWIEGYKPKDVTIGYELGAGARDRPLLGGGAGPV